MTAPAQQYPPPVSPAEPPSALTTFLITFFFGLFGLIPALMHSRAAQAVGRPTKPYWLAFGITIAAQTVVSIILIFVFVAASAAVVGSATASSNDPAKITASEFAQIQTGMSEAEVVQIVGGPGEVGVDSQVAGMTGRILNFDGTEFASNASVQFQDGKVISKSQFGLK